MASVFPCCLLLQCQVLSLLAVLPGRLRRRSADDAFAQGEDRQVRPRLAQIAWRGGHGVPVLHAGRVADKQSETLWSVGGGNVWKRSHLLCTAWRRSPQGHTLVAVLSLWRTECHWWRDDLQSSNFRGVLEIIEFGWPGSRNEANWDRLSRQKPEKESK